MTTPPSENLVSSKEVLRITGISRATLNNYIKMGILPRPRVQRPKEGPSGVRQIGYFPMDVLDRIETVMRLKREGRSMEEIRRHFQVTALPEKMVETDPVRVHPEDYLEGDRTREEPAAPVSQKGVRLTIQDMFLPSYLVNYDFEISWINQKAETRVFRQPVRKIPDGDSRNIFRLFFNWELQKLTLNWKDLVTFHMAFAKSKYARTWIEKIYREISETEIEVLEAAYDRVTCLPGEGLQATLLNLLRPDGTTESYRVYTIFFVEGILFVYAPAKVHEHWERVP